MFDRNVFVIDLETTGTLERIEPTRITEIGIVKIEGTQTTDLYHSFVNPEEPLSDFIKNYTGLNDEILASAPKFCEVADEIANFIGNTDGLIAAWPLAFELPILQFEYAKANKKFPLDRRGIDIGTIAQFYLNANRINLKIPPKGKKVYSLDTVSHTLGLKIDGKRHSAVSDAELEANVLKYIIKQFKGNQ